MTPAELDQLSFALDGPGRAMVAVSLFLMMLGVALGLRVQDFSLIRRTPRVFFAGFLGQIIGLPIATLALIYLLSPPASIALGMVVVAACPGGNVSNMLTYFGKGDVALSVSLTAASSAFAAILTPAAILFWSGLYQPTATLLTSIDVNRLAFVLQTTALLAAPLAIGMLIRHNFDQLSDKIQRPTTILGAGLLGVAIVYGTLSMIGDVVPALAMIVPLAVLHNFVAFCVGGIAGTVAAAGNAQRRSLLFEVGIQNTGLALVILIGQFEGLGG
ncbi:MAG: bile acid:sodium symporter family protein, partial [Pseudomonadota bacterium]